MHTALRAAAGTAFFDFDPVRAHVRAAALRAHIAPLPVQADLRAAALAALSVLTVVYAAAQPQRRRHRTGLPPTAWLRAAWRASIALTPVRTNVRPTAQGTRRLARAVRARGPALRALEAQLAVIAHLRPATFAARRQASPVVAASLSARTP